MSSSNQSVLERLFNLNANQTNVRTEIMAGVTTFLAMCYIIIVNPLILGETGMDMGAVFVALTSQQIREFSGGIILKSLLFG